MLISIANAVTFAVLLHVHRLRCTAGRCVAWWRWVACTIRVTIDMLLRRNSSGCSKSYCGKMALQEGLAVVQQVAPEEQCLAVAVRVVLGLGRQKEVDGASCYQHVGTRWC